MSEQIVIVDASDVKFGYTKLIDETGKFHSSVSVRDALYKANKANLNLVVFNEPKEKEMALCKILDYNKWRYTVEKEKKKNEKKQAKQTKEIQFSTVIGMHDIQHKVNKIKEIIEDGDSVIISVRVNSNNEKQKIQANQRINEIMDLCNVFATEISRKPCENRIEIRIEKK